MCEFITGGGLNAVSLPKSLVNEGSLMRDALLADLAALDYFEIITTHDARLIPVMDSSIEISAKSDCWSIWQELIEQADLVWLIAPESDDILLKLTMLCKQYDKVIIGCNEAQVIATTGSKYATYKALQSANILTIPTYRVDDHQELYNDTTSSFIVKPDDGVGCEGVRHCDSQQELQEQLATHNKKWVVQPFQRGNPASIAMLCKDGKAWLLSCNQQIVQRTQGKLSLKGVIINAMVHHWLALDQLAQKIATAIPDLRGFIGVDVIIDDTNIYVVEINPRLTTSYAGLSLAMNSNTAKLVLDCLLKEIFEMPIITKNKVEILL